MKKQINPFYCFGLGMIAAATVMMFLGAGYPHAPQQRYSVDFDEIEGMKNRLSIEIVDHYHRQAHLYIVPPTNSSLTDRHGRKLDRLPPVNSPKLVATIDLDSAGKTELRALFKEHVYAPQVY